MTTRERIDSPLRPPEPHADEPGPRRPRRAAAAARALGLGGGVRRAPSGGAEHGAPVQRDPRPLPRRARRATRREARQTVARPARRRARPRARRAAAPLARAGRQRARALLRRAARSSEADFSLDVLPLDFEPPPRRLSVELAGRRRGRAAAADRRRPGGAARRRPGGRGRAAQLAAGALPRALRRPRATGFDLDFARGLPVRGADGARVRDRGAPARARPRDGRRVLALRCRRSSRPFDVPVFFFSS